MDFDEILFEKEKGIAILTLNRADRLNAFTNRVYQELPNIMGRIEKDAVVKSSGLWRKRHPMSNELGK